MGMGMGMGMGADSQPAPRKLIPSVSYGYQVTRKNATEGQHD
jgi:hypothetical protein